MCVFLYNMAPIYPLNATKQQKMDEPSTRPFCCVSLDNYRLFFLLLHRFHFVCKAVVEYPVTEPHFIKIIIRISS